MSTTKYCGHQCSNHNTAILTDSTTTTKACDHCVWMVACGSIISLSRHLVTKFVDSTVGCCGQYIMYMHMYAFSMKVSALNICMYDTVSYVVCNSVLLP